MVNVAILGFGVVGGGVADLLSKNSSQLTSLIGDEVKVKYILDLRDFPDSQFASRVIHDYNIILSDPDVEYVIEAMGGSHPAYEYTISALRAKKSVITSNKEVVSRFGDEFLRVANENGVGYRFEASVGGGIPVISPIINCVRHNKITEVRGILNGTTNYILTRMFSFGAGFDESLKDAQDKGYAERNPDADVLGIDASRKIAILSALATGRLVSTDKIHTEGITEIRLTDVNNAEKLGHKVKLLGRCIIREDGMQIMVAPFMLPSDSPLSGVNGVNNAVEVIGEPVGSVMFYGPGAGAGPTASAIVGDLVQLICSKNSQVKVEITKSDEYLDDFTCFEARNYIALSGINKETIAKTFGKVQIVSEGDEVAFITAKISEENIIAKLSTVEKAGAARKARIRIV